LFVWKGISGTLLTLGAFDVVGIALATILVVGLILRFREPREPGTSGMLLPVVLLGTVPVYLGIVGYQRSSSGLDYATYSHHLWTVGCFVVPALGVALDAVFRRAPALAPLFAGFFLLPLPFNLRGFDQSGTLNVFLSTGFLQRNRQMLSAVAHSPYAAQALHVDRTRLATDVWYSGILTVGWALDRAKEGRIPRPDPVDPGLDESLQLSYGLTQLTGEAPPSGCDEQKEPITIRPAQGETLRTGTPVAVHLARRPESTAAVVYGSAANPAEGQALRVEIPSLALRLSAVDGMASFTLCRAR
jgi:hypothetical protein